MADLVAFNVSPLFVGPRTHIRTQLAAPAGVTLGQAVMLDPATGKVGLASAASTASSGFRGIVSSAPFGFVGALTADVLESGYVAGFDLSGLAYDAPVYLSDTPGMLSSTPGTNRVAVGRVVSLTDRDPVSGLSGKVLFIPHSLS